MKISFDCPICEKRNWAIHKKYIFKKDNHISPKMLNFKRYLALRLHVLHYIWFNHGSDVELISQYCDNCGFMCYSPRPTKQDLDLKYGFLNDMPVKENARMSNLKSEIFNDFRAKRIYNIAQRFFKKKKLMICDYGGQDGRLLKYFTNSDNKCYLIDYNEKVIPGVIRAW